MHTTELPGCCGVLVVSDFPFLGYNTTTQRTAAKAILYRELAEIERQCIGGRGDSQSMLMATVIEPQLRYLRGTFKKAGWSVGDPFYHPSHESRISVVTKVLYPDE